MTPEYRIALPVEFKCTTKASRSASTFVLRKLASLAPMSVRSVEVVPPAMKIVPSP
jgi:hypothetical protein